MSKAMEERRFSILYVHENAMLRWFRAIVSGRVSAAKIQGLPEDVEIARVSWDNPKQSWALVLASRFYMPVDLGRQVPELTRVIVEFDTYSPNARIMVEGELSRPYRMKVSGMVTQRLWQEYLASTTPQGWKPKEEDRAPEKVCEVEEVAPDKPAKRPRGRPRKTANG
jgi:hypothetical protein